jgi:hypothetical protein
MNRSINAKGFAMFSVKWGTRQNENQPIETESSVFTDLDQLVASCREALYGMRLRHIALPPDGFIISDADGKELRRWFGSYMPACNGDYQNAGASSKR